MYSKILVLAIILIILIPLNAYAGTSTQTDWSGGDGIYGPNFEWYNVFYTDTNIECYYNTSNLILLRTISQSPIEYTVDVDFNGASSVCSANIDGDNDMDILGAAFSDSDIAWWENNNGTGTSWTKHTVDGDFTNATSVYSADIDGDGDMDVLGSSHGDNTIAWWENVNGLGTDWTKHIVDDSVLWTKSAYSEDIDGDGDMDVLGVATGDDEVIWWENDNGIGTSWTEHLVDGSFGSGQSVYAADVNGDGYMDALGASFSDNDITWWENLDGSGINWTEHIVEGDYSDAMSVYVADVNGDGYLDVLGAARSADDITWWQNLNGSGNYWVEHTIDEAFDAANCVYAADFDADGDMDVLGTASYDKDITCWENLTGSGTTWTEHTLNANFDGAMSAFSADINGDGYMDALGAAQTDDDIIWWDLTKFPSSGSLESSVLYTQESPDWENIDWTCTEPSGTSVGFQVRASLSQSNLGPWSDTLTSPCNLDGILSDEDHFFQYRAILTTTDSVLTPVLHDITVNWQLLGIHEGCGGGIALYGARPNPTTGNATLFFALPVESDVELCVFDLTGRMVDSVSEHFEQGVHEVVLDDLACGMYLVWMTSEEFTETRRFVVMD